MDIGSIRRKLAALRTKLRILLLGHGVARVAATLAVLVIASFVMDWLFQLPWGARAVMLLLMIGVLAWSLYRHLLKPMRVDLDDEKMALLVESRHPEFGHELISALQLSRQIEDEDNFDSKEMMSSVVAQANRRFEGVSFSDALSGRPLAGPAFLSLAALLVVAMFASFAPDHTSLWFDRCILLKNRAWPPKTKLDVRIANIDKYRHEIRADGNQEIWVPESSVVRVEVRAEGDIPSSVRLKKYVYPRSENPTPVTIEMGERAEAGEFEYKFGRVSSSFEFYAEGGDDRDEKPYFVVNVRTAPRIDAFDVAYDYPDYINESGREDRDGVREYNIVGPVGTEARLRFKTSTPLRHFALILDDNGDDPIALQPSESDPTVFEWKTTLEADHFYTYRLIGENGTPSREVPNFNISAQPDLPPQLGVSMPELTSADVTAEATVPLKVQVSDDYGLGAMEFRWDTDRDGLFTNRVVFQDENLRQPNDDARDLVAFLLLEMKDFRVVEGDSTRALRAGDSLYLRLEARDERKTKVNPEPNVSIYPSLITLNVREVSEIERELVRGQVRTKEQVERSEEAVVLRREELDRVLQDLAAGKTELAPIQSLIAAQALITSSLSEASRGFTRIFDGYLFNRTDPSNLTEALIASLAERHRTLEGTHYEFVTAALPEVESRIDESEAMGKLARIMGLLIQAADRESPAVGSALRNALEDKDLPSRRAALESGLKAQDQLLLTLRALVDKMEEWEDFQDVIQSLKDILELQKGLSERVKTLPK